MIVWHVETSAGPRFDWARDEEQLRRQLIEYNNDTLNSGEPGDQLDDDAELEEAIEKIEELENFSREDMDGAHLFDTKERDTVLAALRYWQRNVVGKGYREHYPEWDIAADAGDPLDTDAIDELCGRLSA